MLQALRREETVDSLRVGLWARGAAAPVAAAALLLPAAAFVVLEKRAAVLGCRCAAISGAEPPPGAGAGPFRRRRHGTQRPESARRLRAAVGARAGSQVRTFPRADARFVVPGQTSTDGKWTWPTSAPGYLQAVREWVK